MDEEMVIDEETPLPRVSPSQIKQKQKLKLKHEKPARKQQIWFAS